MFSELNRSIYPALQFSVLISFFTPFSIISNHTSSYPLDCLTLSPSHLLSAEKNVFLPSQNNRNTGISTSSGWHSIYKVMMFTDHSLIMTANVSFWLKLIPPLILWIPWILLKNFIPIMKSYPIFPYLSFSSCIFEKSLCLFHLFLQFCFPITWHC